jgi:hypothetical protein
VRFDRVISHQSSVHLVISVIKKRERINVFQDSVALLLLPTDSFGGLITAVF